MKIKYLILPAAGFGTRMRSISGKWPKEMLAINGKPAIHYAAYNGLIAGLSHLILIIRNGKEIIAEYFESKKICHKFFPQAITEHNEIVNNMNIHIRYQAEALGECDAILTAKDIINESPFAVIYPDNLYNPKDCTLKFLINSYSKTKSDTIALTPTTSENIKGLSNSGKVQLVSLNNKLHKIIKFFPKDRGLFKQRYLNELRISGTYVASPQFIKFIDLTLQNPPDNKKWNTEIGDSFVRQRMLDNGHSFFGLKCPGIIYDIGNPSGYAICLKNMGKDQLFGIEK